MCSRNYQNCTVHPHALSRPLDTAQVSSGLTGGVHWTIEKRWGVSAAALPGCRCLMVRCYLILPKLLRALAHPPSAQRSLLPEHILCVGRKLPQIAPPLTSQLLL